MIAVSVARFGIPTFIAASGDIVGASFLLAIYPLGSVIANLMYAWITKRVKAQHMGRTAVFTWFILNIILVITTMLYSPLWLIVALSIVISFIRSIMRVTGRTIQVAWGEFWVQGAGPMSQIGTGIGSIVVAWMAASHDTAWLFLFILPFVFSSASLITPTQDNSPSDQTWSWSTLTDNFLISIFGYMTAAISVTLITLTAGIEWVGIGLAVYGFSSILAPFIFTHVKHLLHNRLNLWIFLVNLTNLVWFLVLIHPIWGAMVALMVSSILLHVVEGSANIVASEEKAFASTIAGREIGLVCAGMVGSILLTVNNSAIFITGVFFVFGLLLSLGLLVGKKIKNGTTRKKTVVGLLPKEPATITGVIDLR